jgi:hypothetical protein
MAVDEQVDHASGVIRPDVVAGCAEAGQRLATARNNA